MKGVFFFAFTFAALSVCGALGRADFGCELNGKDLSPLGAIHGTYKTDIMSTGTFAFNVCGPAKACSRQSLTAGCLILEGETANQIDYIPYGDVSTQVIDGLVGAQPPAVRFSYSRAGHPVRSFSVHVTCDPNAGASLANVTAAHPVVNNTVRITATSSTVCTLTSPHAAVHTTNTPNIPTPAAPTRSLSIQSIPSIATKPSHTAAAATNAIVHHHSKCTLEVQGEQYDLSGLTSPEGGYFAGTGHASFYINICAPETLQHCHDADTTVCMMTEEGSGSEPRFVNTPIGTLSTQQLSLNTSSAFGAPFITAQYTAGKYSVAVLAVCDELAGPQLSHIFAQIINENQYRFTGNSSVACLNKHKQ